MDIYTGYIKCAGKLTFSRNVFPVELAASFLSSILCIVSSLLTTVTYH